MLKNSGKGTQKYINERSADRVALIGGQLPS